MNGLPRNAAQPSRTITIVNASRKYATPGSSTPGFACMVVTPPTSHEPPNKPSVAAATVSRARNAKTVAISSSGATKVARIKPIVCPSLVFTHGASRAAYRNIPIPNAKKPSGIDDPYGRTTTRTCGCTPTGTWRARGVRCETSLGNRCEARCAAREAALLEVLLVVVLRLPEGRRIFDLRHDRA